MNIEPHMQNIIKKQAGFTLIEVMIALVLLAAGLLALMTMQIVSIKANAFSSEMTYTAMLAQHKLEELKNLPSTDTKLQTGNHPLTAEAADPWYRAQDNKGISYNITHRVWNNSPAANMTRIQLTIQWIGSAAGQQSTQTYTASFSTVLSSLTP